MQSFWRSRLFLLRDWGQKCGLLKPELAQCQQSFEVPLWLWFVNVVKVRKNTRYRFNCLINELKSAKCSRLRQVLLQVINSLIDHAPNTTDRIHIRNECIGQFYTTRYFAMVIIYDYNINEFAVYSIERNNFVTNVITMLAWIEVKISSSSEKASL